MTRPESQHRGASRLPAQAFGLLLLFTLITFSSPAADALEPGLLAEYYDVGKEIKFLNSIPDDKKLALIRVDANINLDLKSDAVPGTTLKEHFHVIWTGVLRVPKDGEYVLDLQSDDGSWLKLNDRMVVNHDGLHSKTNKAARVRLQAGDHDLEVQWFENANQAACILSWQPPGGVLGVVPASALFHRPLGHTSAQASPTAAPKPEMSILTDLPPTPAPQTAPPLPVVNPKPGTFFSLQPGLVGEYYDTMVKIRMFSELPQDRTLFARRVDPQINVDLGAGPVPGTQMADRYYVVWDGVLRVPRDGDYTFVLRSDDGSRLRLGGQLALDNDKDHPATSKTNVVTLTRGDYALQVEWFEYHGTASCVLMWRPPGGEFEVIPATALFHPPLTKEIVSPEEPAKVTPPPAAPTKSAAKPGLVGEYFALRGAVRDFPKVHELPEPTVRLVDATVNFPATRSSFGQTQLVDSFYVRWTGFIKIGMEDKYTFLLHSSDGSRLYLNGTLVVDNSGVHKMQERTGEVQLKAGNHRLLLEYFENDGEAGCQLLWSQMAAPFEPVSPKALFHESE